MIEKMSFGGEVACSAREFVESAVRLYTCEHHWKSAQLHGYSLLDALYAEKQLSDSLVCKILATKHHLEEVRKNNVLGAILFREQYRSTKYFSHWIEAKKAAK